MNPPVFYAAWDIKEGRGPSGGMRINEGVLARPLLFYGPYYSKGGI